MFDKASLDRLFEELRDEFELETDWEEIQRDAHFAAAYAAVGVLSGNKQVLHPRSVDFVERHSSLLLGHGSLVEPTFSSGPLADIATLAQLTFAEIAAVYGEEVAIHAGIANDEDAWIPTTEDFAQARPTKDVLRRGTEAQRSGDPKLPPKTPTEKVNVEIALDNDVIAFFKHLDADWQTRLNNFLRVIIFRRLPGSLQPEQTQTSS